ncbi:receptor like protein kinase S.2 [Iris pallida]|uniref:Receptor like protein kinase S.2 n=1 Tax=Iris pallida TaxID=29817 RepID=A0AAX6FY40_IRIPA|nr:receptor like protein kinase S.2 [Iris pallida]
MHSVDQKHFRPPQVHRHQPARHLEHNHAETVHVRRRLRVSGLHVLRGHVTEDPPRRRRRPQAGDVVPVLVPGQKFREGEAAEPRVHVGVQEDGGRRYVPVDHLLVPFLVEVENGGRQGLDDPVPVVPREDRVPVVEEVVAEQAAGRVVVDDEHLPSLGAPAAELDQVAVPEPPEVQELVGEPGAQRRARLHPEPLDEHVDAVVEVAAVARAEVQLRHHFGLVEVVGDRDDLAVGDLPGRVDDREGFEGGPSVVRVAGAAAVVGSEEDGGAGGGQEVGRSESRCSGGAACAGAGRRGEGDVERMELEGWQGREIAGSGQRLGHPFHRRPRLRIVEGAEQAEVDQPPHVGLRIGSFLQLPVPGVQPLPLVRQPTHPVEQYDLIVRIGEVDRPSARRDLQHDDAEAEHVRLGGSRALPLEALWREVPDRAADPAGVREPELEGALVHRRRRPQRHPQLAVLQPPREAEVPEPRVVPGVEHDVAGLDVAVDDLRVELLVEVVQRRREARHDPLAPLPGERRRRGRGGGGEEEAVEAVVGHVVVDEEQLVVVHAPAPQADEVAVAELRDRDKLGCEGLLEAVAALGDALDGREGAVAGEHGAVDPAEAAAAEDFLLAEAVGAYVELGVAEYPRVGAAAGDLLVEDLGDAGSIVEVARILVVDGWFGREALAWALPPPTVAQASEGAAEE